MSTPRKNPTIGQIGCWTPGCGHMAAVRRDGRGRFYMVCIECGRHAHEGQHAQDVIADNAEIWGEQGDPPAHAQRWIAEDWGHAHTIRNIQRARQPIGGAPGEHGGEPAPSVTPEGAPGSEPAPAQGEALTETPRAPTGAPSVVPPPEDPPPADPPAPDPEPQEPPTAAELEGDDEDDEEDPDDWP